MDVISSADGKDGMKKIVISCHFELSLFKTLTVTPNLNPNPNPNHTYVCVLSGFKKQNKKTSLLPVSGQKT